MIFAKTLSKKWDYNNLGKMEKKMRKELLCLAKLAMAGCATADAGDGDRYNFRYHDGDLVKCTDKKFEGRMCEKDGKTLANGSHFIQTVQNIIMYFNGKKVFDEAYIKDGEAFFDRKVVIASGSNPYKNVYTFDELKDGKLIVSSCDGKKYFKEENLKEFERLTDGTNSCDFLKETEEKSKK